MRRTVRTRRDSDSGNAVFNTDNRKQAESAMLQPGLRLIRREQYGISAETLKVRDALEATFLMIVFESVCRAQLIEMTTDRHLKFGTAGFHQ